MVAGLIVSVRLFPVPPMGMFELATSVRFEEVAVMTRLPAGVSASLTEKGTGAVG